MALRGDPMTTHRRAPAQSVEAYESDGRSSQRHRFTPSTNYKKRNILESNNLSSHTLLPSKIPLSDRAAVQLNGDAGWSSADRYLACRGRSRSMAIKRRNCVTTAGRSTGRGRHPWITATCICFIHAAVQKTASYERGGSSRLV